jgi:hypothetical protein
MENEREVFTLAIPKKSGLSLDVIDRAAKGIGDNRVEFCMKAIELLVGMDSPIVKYLEELAEKLNTRLPIIIQNFLIERLAKDEAGIEIFGLQIISLSEFVSTNEGMITGKKLFDLRKTVWKKQLKSDYVEQILRLQAAHAPLTDEQNAILKRNGYQSNDADRNEIRSLHGKKFLLDLLGNEIINKVEFERLESKLQEVGAIAEAVKHDIDGVKTGILDRETAIQAVKVLIKRK